MGIVVTFGLMGYLNMQLNPANLMAVPMILGIGVDYSVYIVHEYLEQKGRYRMSPGTAIAVTVDAIDDADRLRQPADCQPSRIAKPGPVLTIAVTFCTLMSVVVLPAFLVWISRNRPLVPWVGDAVESYDHEEADEQLMALDRPPAPDVDDSPGSLGGDRTVQRTRRNGTAHCSSGRG